MSCRQIRRVVNQVKFEEDRGGIHRSRGRLSKQKIPDKIKDKVIKLYRTQYKDFGQTLASEKEGGREGIRINNESLRIWFMEREEWKKGSEAREASSEERTEALGQKAIHYCWGPEREYNTFG